MNHIFELSEPYLQKESSNAMGGTVHRGTDCPATDIIAKRTQSYEIKITTTPKNEKIYKQNTGFTIKP